MSTVDEIAKRIHELLNPPTKPATVDEQKAEAAAWMVGQFEQRAREVDAIQLRYYPGTITASTNEIGMERLRRLARSLLKL